MSTERLGHIELTGDSATVAFERRYATSAEDLWNALTNPERLERWFARVTGDLYEGGIFVIHFDDADTPQCRVRSCASPVSFSWVWPHEDRESLVEVRVTGDDSGSVLHLTHSKLSASSAPGYGAGWDAYVRHLDAHLDGTEPEPWWPTWESLRELYAQVTAR